MERRNLESAAANYSYLRGLHSIPVGVLFVLSALGNLEWGPLGRVWVFPAGVALAATAYLGISRFYRQNYGRVSPSARAQVRAGVAGAAVGVIVVGAVLLDWNLDLPVSLTAIAFALVLLAHYAVGMGLRPHHKVVCAALGVAGALPFWGDADHRINLGLLLAGVAIAVSGIFDHAALRREFGPAGGLDRG
ncbi:hypothetical protein EDD29_4724 [Actinocorallia herbida]|uniref:Uncharacterized protein n=1 Tax=Actinocorallia herbida TaxID=58109 RepID=A0A3N1D0S4_9ACTN|nr:hypothetical protein [Actinocorallia herbida]ROO87133.1 hypothetical protein EDD29_4724 [Actinocorallia herbida]